MNGERLRTPAEAAERCQISVKTVLRAIHAGRLRASRLGASGAYRMRDADIDAWIEASVVTPQRRATTRYPPAARPLPTRDDPPVGRLTLTDDLGRHL